MLLYHGSKTKIEKLERRQAKAKPGVEVPEGELLNAIYFTPDYGSAISMAARPSGLTTIEDGKIEFENPELFDPEREIYIYTIDSDNIPPEYLKMIDENQYAITMAEGVRPDSVEIKKAGEVMKYYELTNWKPKEEVEKSEEEKEEPKKEMNFKMR